MLQQVILHTKLCYKTSTLKIIFRASHLHNDAFYYNRIWRGIIVVFLLYQFIVRPRKTKRSSIAPALLQEICLRLFLVVRDF